MLHRYGIDLGTASVASLYKGKGVVGPSVVAFDRIPIRLKQL